MISIVLLLIITVAISTLALLTVSEKTEPKSWQRLLGVIAVFTIQGLAQYPIIHYWIRPIILNSMK